MGRFVEKNIVDFAIESFYSKEFSSTCPELDSLFEVDVEDLEEYSDEEITFEGWKISETDLDELGDFKLIKDNFCVYFINTAQWKPYSKDESVFGEEESLIEFLKDFEKYNAKAIIKNNVTLLRWG